MNEESKKKIRDLLDRLEDAMDQDEFYGLEWLLDEIRKILDE